MKIVRCNWFPPKGYKAIMLVWWLIVKTNAVITAKFINHEEIHERQQKEMLVLPFFIWYGIEWFVLFLKYRDWMTAYQHIRFEQEAYRHQNDLSYLKNRRHYHYQ